MKLHSPVNPVQCDAKCPAAIAISAPLHKPATCLNLQGEYPVSQLLVPVYRMHQPTLFSPCILGDPCHTCAIHAYCLSHPCKDCLQGKTVACERAYPSPPAFTVRFRSAIALVRDGMAQFIHQNSALQLTFAKITYLRDTSCNINGIAIWEYAAGSNRVKAALYVGWRKNLATITSIDDETLTDLEMEDEADMPGEAFKHRQMYAAKIEA
jgi:hypothetical protein